MLFSLKRRAGPAALALVVLLALGLAGRAGLDLGGDVDLDATAVLFGAACGLAVVGASDGILHGLLSLLGRAAYRSRYRDLVAFFEGQGGLAIVLGGAVAGAEEVVFRGVVLAGLAATPVGPAGALAVSAALFGLAHAIPDRRLAPFAIWAVWEGALLGGVYLWSGSLLTSIVVHAAHDIGGFALFALQRRTGWLL